MSDQPSTFLKAASRVEAWISRGRRKRRAPQEIEPYAGFATPDHLIVQGRVHDRYTRAEPDLGQGRLANVMQMLAMFRTEEVAGAIVSAGGVRVPSDEEGYFTLKLPRGGETGWRDVEVTLEANGSTTLCPVLVPDDTGADMIISDIDDTVMRTGAYSLVRNLWTTFTGNALSREVFADAAVLLERLSGDGRRPVYYVSSSPWNIYYFLVAVFERASVVKGPMFLRDLGLSETKLITAGHGRHKAASIDTILAANPDRYAVLMGDTGQKDAKIYREVVLRHQGRIRAVVLRTPGPGLDHDGRRAIAALEETGVPVFYGHTFAGFSEHIREVLC